MNRITLRALTGNLHGDLAGGLTAAVVALPLALAFGVSSGAGPVAGLYGAICVGLFAALFGGTPAQISGPTGPMTVVMSAIFTQYVGMFPDDPGRGLSVAFTVVILGGLFQILFGILRLGSYINLVPHSVVSGFMSGIGIIIILLQLPPLLGMAAVGGPLESAMQLPAAIAGTVPAELLVGLFALAVIYLQPPSIGRWLPAPLVALVAGTLLVVALGLGDVRVLGEIPGGLPSLMMPSFEWALLPDMLKSALTLAALGAIDSLLTSLVADNITRTHHDSDRELIGQGIGNTVAGLLGGLPGAGATMRTVVNVNAGGKTPLSGIVHALVLLAIVLGAGPLAASIPHAVLAGILIKVGTDIIDWDYLRRVRSVPPAGAVMMTTVLLITVFVDLITAVAVGVIMASLVFVKRMTDLQVAGIRIYTHPDETAPLNDEERRLLRIAKGAILYYQLAGPMSFGAAKEMVHRIAHFDGYKVLILDLREVPMLDTSSSRAVEDIIADTGRAGRSIYLVGPQPAVEKFLTARGILQRVPEERRWHHPVEALQSACREIGADTEAPATDEPPMDEPPA